MKTTVDTKRKRTKLNRYKSKVHAATHVENNSDNKYETQEHTIETGYRRTSKYNTYIQQKNQYIEKYTHDIEVGVTNNPVVSLNDPWIPYD